MSLRALVTAAVLGAALARGAFGQTSSSSLPPAAAGVSFEQRLGAVVPFDEPLSGEDGKPVTLREVAGGKPLVLVLVWYRCPMLCGEMTNGVLRSLRAVSLEAGSDFRVAFLSIDPREGADLATKKKQNVCAEYGRPGCEQGLRFLTGTAASTEAIAAAVGYRYHWDEASASYVHAAGIVVLTPAGVVSRYLFGVDYPPRDLRLALLDSAAERIGTLADQLLLLCYHYDPATGRYGFAIQNALRIGGIATVAALVLGLWRMSRRPRPRVSEG
jgi:protein SCO1